MASCDADCRFTFVDIGSPGSEGDMNVFSRSQLGRNILSDTATMNFPPSSIINGEETPYFFIADDAFPLTNRIMKPFNTRNITNSQRIFNYRLSRARRTIENAFGILTMRWGCLRSEFISQPEKVKTIVSACCALHNFLLNQHCTSYATSSSVDRYASDGTLIEGDFFCAAQSMDGLDTVSRRQEIESASNMRNNLMDYVCHVDVLEWQHERAYCVAEE